jgi:drug/metabolite transporter (DMT)-like permease
VSSRSAWLALALYILLRGSDSTVLRWLQRSGSAAEVASQGGGNPISVCNVFFFSSLICGVVVLLLDRQRVRRQWPRLRPADRGLLALQGALGFLVGPTALYLALDRLGVIPQTLLFALILPVSALLGLWLLGERLPPRFPLSVVLLLAGLLLASGSMGGMGLPAGTSGLDPRGVGWALVSVAAFSGSGVLNRMVAARGWGPGLTVGLGSVAAALVFGVAAVLLFGPEHFLHLRLWWVLGVLGLYACVITLGSQLALMASYRDLGIARISLWGALSLPIAFLEAGLLLGEPIGVGTIVGLATVLAALAVSSWPRPPRWD